MCLDVDVVHMLLGLDRLKGRLAEDGTQLSRGLRPLRAGQSFGAHEDLALRRDDDDQLGHASCSG
jgi:hypothetical protein